MKSCLAAFIIAAAWGTAVGLEVPKGSRYDARIQHVDYNDADVVVLQAAVGLGTRVVFAQDERILDIASGFTAGWEFLDRQNILYIKPKSVASGKGTTATLNAPEPGKWDTNLMVTTTKRLYDFDLKLIDPTAATPTGPALASYRVEFRYPAEVAAAERAAIERSKKDAKATAKPAPLNWAYTLQAGPASEAIVPAMAYDDGRFTYLRFPNNRDFPVAFLVAEDKSESLVNTHVEGDLLVVHRVVRELVLRLGKAVVSVYNEDYDADGLPTEAGSSAPGLRRQLKDPAP